MLYILLYHIFGLLRYERGGNKIPTVQDTLGQNLVVSLTRRKVVLDLEKD
jgi:hypothetical protein